MIKVVTRVADHISHAVLYGLTLYMIIN